MFMMPTYGYHTEFYGLDAFIHTMIISSLSTAALISLAFFLFEGYSLYCIARHRGLKKPWLSWIPVGQDWICGSISDQYRYLTAGQIKHRRVILSVLSAVKVALGSVAVILSVRILTILVFGMAGYDTPRHIRYQVAQFAAAAVVLAVVAIGFWIARLILHHMCMYDLYRSADPKNGTAMTALGIIVHILEPFFLFYVREKDEGMPPRRDGTGRAAQSSAPCGTERPVDTDYRTPEGGPEQL